MRKLLRNFLTWLDHRFPERVVVTQAEFVAMKAQLDQTTASAKKTEDRLFRIESEINKFNVSMGFGGSAPKMVAPFQR